MIKTSDVIQKRWLKAKELSKAGVELYPNDFKVLHDIGTIKKRLEGYNKDVSEEKTVFVVAGRILAIRRFGKAAFLRFMDRTGELQAYVKEDRVGSEAYKLFKQFDIGDFVGIEGGMFKTRTGEWTLLVDSIRLLCKAIRPLPEKFHGLKDTEKRYRQRYLDLIMNPDVRSIFLIRSQVIQTIRDFLRERDFIEVETPMMHPIPGGAEASPFKTYHNALGMELYLRVAPELYLKRLVIGGFERVFEINRCFRNEGVSTQHNPEFTMLEFYQAYATYEELMALTEDMFLFVTEKVLNTNTLTYQGVDIDLKRPWRRMSLKSALSELGGLEDSLFNDRKGLLEFAESKGIHIRKTHRIGKILTKIFDALVEPKLIEPTFITDYPVDISPLSRRSDKDQELTERFELFIAGKEIANGFSELNDPEDQRGRFLQQVADREAGDEEAHLMDEDYIRALEYGMPPTAGEGVGIDRLVMLLTDTPSIREVILFPHLRTVTD